MVKWSLTGGPSASTVSQSFVPSITPFDCIWAKAPIFNWGGGVLLLCVTSTCHPNPRIKNPPVTHPKELFLRFGDPHPHFKLCWAVSRWFLYCVLYWWISVFFNYLPSSLERLLSVIVNISMCTDVTATNIWIKTKNCSYKLDRTEETLKQN